LFSAESVVGAIIGYNTYERVKREGWVG